MTGDEAGCPSIEGRGLRVVRGARVVLRDVDVTARAREVVGILGPSGAGKSTLFRALTGDLAVDAGTVELAGRDVTSWPLWRRARAGIGFMPQEPSVLWDLSVRGNLETFARIATGTPGDAGAVAKSVGLAERMSVRAGDLSAGERRRLELARALSRKPSVVVCDEPFAGVDPAGAGRLGELLAALAETGVAVLLADHHVAEALRVCTRAVLLVDGAVALSASPETFRKDPLVRQRYLGEWVDAASS